MIEPLPYLDTMAAGLSAYCDDCGSPNRAEEEEEYEDSYW